MEKKDSRSGDRQLLRFLSAGQTARILGIGPDGSDFVGSDQAYRAVQELVTI